MDLAIALFGEGIWAIRQACQELRDTFRTKRVVLVLIEEFLKIKAVVPALFGVPAVAVVAAEDCVVGVDNIVVRVARGIPFPCQENQGTKTRGLTNQALP
jgi:hypothetical protein